MLICRCQDSFSLWRLGWEIVSGMLSCAITKFGSIMTSAWDNSGITAAIKLFRVVLLQSPASHRKLKSLYQNQARSRTNLIRANV